MCFETSVTKCPMVQLKHQADITLKKGPTCVFETSVTKCPMVQFKHQADITLKKGPTCFRNVGNEMSYGSVEAPSRYYFEDGTNMFSKRR